MAYVDRNWKFYLLDSADMSAIGELSGARGKRLELLLNRPGSLSFNLRLNDELAYYVAELETCVIAYCDDGLGVPRPRWSGPVWTTDRQAAAGSSALSVSCVGWQELLNYRQLREAMTFANLDATEIGKRLVLTANGTIANGQTPETLVTNGSFEADLSSWTLGSSGSVTGVPAISNVYSVHGSKSLYLNSTATAAGSQFALQNVPVTAGSQYTLAGDVNVISVAGGMSLSLLIDWRNAAAGFISSSTISVVATGERRATQTFVAPAGAVRADVRIVAAASAAGSLSAYVDNLVLAPGATPGYRPTPITPGATPVTQNRTRTFQVGQNIGQGVQELSDIEAGYDYEVDPITRVMDFRYDVVKGTIRGIGQDRPDCVWGYNWGPRNVRSVTERRDGSRTANRMNARGRYGVGMAQDLAAIAQYGLFEDSVSLSDVADSAILARFAGAEVAYRLRPQRTYSFVPYPWDGTDRVPRIFVDYDLGDITYLTAQEGALDVQNQAVRVFGATVEIDDNGNENVSALQTAAGG